MASHEEESLRPQAQVKAPVRAHGVAPTVNRGQSGLAGCWEDTQEERGGHRPHERARGATSPAIPCRRPGKVDGALACVCETSTLGGTQAQHSSS